MQKLADTMLKADEFYDSLGGIIGYQAKCLELISHQDSASPSQGTTEDVKVNSAISASDPLLRLTAAGLNTIRWLILTS